MIQVIAGKKGSGKTKRLIDLTNTTAREAVHDVVFLDDGDGRRRHAFLRMLQVLFRILLVVVIMQQTDRLPVFDILSEMLRHSPHGVTNVKRVQYQMPLRNHRVVQFPGSFQCQHYFIILQRCVFPLWPSKK